MNRKSRLTLAYIKKCKYLKSQNQTNLKRNLWFKLPAILLTISVLLSISTPGFSLTDNYEKKVDLIDQLLRSYNLDSAKLCLTEFEKDLKTQKDPIYRLIYFEQTAKLLKLSGLYTKTKTYSDSIKLVADNIKPTTHNDSFYLARAYNTIGIIIKDLDNNSKSLQYFRKSIALAGSSQRISIAYFKENYGIALIDNGNVEEGLNYINGACNIFIAKNDTLGLFSTSMKIANTMVDYRNFELSKKYFDIAQKMIETKQNTYEYFSFLNDKGRMMNYEMKYDSSLIYFMNANKIALAITDEYGNAIASSNIGETFIKLKRYKESEEYLLNALKLFENFEMHMGIVQVNSLLAYSHSKNGDLKKAKEYQTNAEKLIRSIDFPPALLSDFYQRTYEIKQAEGNYKSAFENLFKHHEFQDSLNNVLNTWKVNELESRLLTNIKEKQLTEKEDQLLKAQKDMFRFLFLSLAILTILLSLYWFLYYRSKKEKQLHRISQDLMSQEYEKGVLQMQLMMVRNRLSPHLIANLFLDLKSLMQKQDNEKALSLVDNISKMVLYSYTYNESITASLGEEIDFVRNYIEVRKPVLGEQFTSEINIDLNATDITIPSMIIQLFVENAIKHGLIKKQGEKNLTIKASLKKDFLLIEIEDNGIGREKAKELETDGTGMGFFIMEKVTTHLNAQNLNHIRWEVIDKQDSFSNASGTLVKIVIPKKYNY